MPGSRGRWGSRESSEMDRCGSGTYALHCFLAMSFFFSSRRRHTRFDCDWSSDVCSSDLPSTNVSGPLIIVDGTITRHGLADINSQDIDRVELVKGAAASSLYGSDAANGVIQILTKPGGKLADGRLALTVRHEYGQSVRPEPIPVSLAHPYV